MYSGLIFATQEALIALGAVWSTWCCSCCRMYRGGPYLWRHYTSRTACHGGIAIVDGHRHRHWGIEA